MTYNAQLAEKVRAGLAGHGTVDEKRMMGGLTFMVNGKMCVGINKDDLMFRRDPLIYEEALKRKGSRIGVIHLKVFFLDKHF